MAIDLFRKQMQGSLRGMPYGMGAKNDISAYNGSDLPIVFGRGVFGYRGVEGMCMPPVADTKTVTLSKAMVAGDELTITVKGEVFVQAFDTDMDTTASAMLAKLNADVKVEATYATLVFTVISLYNTNDVVGACTGTSAPTVAIGTGTVSSTQVLLGVALRYANDGMLRDEGEQDVYPSGSGVNIRNLGGVVVEAKDIDGVSVSGNACVSTLVADAGKFVASTASDKRAMGNSFYGEKTPNQDIGDNLIVCNLVGGVY